ncbi:MAG: glutamate 5-kinase [Lachnospiraceae bacterium]|nr:glutamate 5-kinase [Lachnospiraceae bacterium]
MTKREELKNKKRVVVKIGSSSITHPETGAQDLIKLEKLVRQLTDLKNRGVDVTLVTSGAISVGKKALHMKHSTRGHDELSVARKQACAAVGQARLMTTYQKLFSEYNQVSAQVLITLKTIADPISRRNAHNTFMELFELGVIPVVNENDTVATYEIESLGTFGDNDTLSAIVASIVEADLLILLSDVDGLYTDDPRVNPEARFIGEVENLSEKIYEMGKSTTGSSVGTGGMNTKLKAAQIATASGADMVIASGEDVSVVGRIIDGEEIGTLFHADSMGEFDVNEYVNMP